MHQMKIKRNLIQACLLCVVMPSFSDTVHAQFTVWTNNDDGTIGITEYTGSGGLVNIPPSVNGHPVTDLDGFSEKTNVTSVAIPNTVKYISSKAFEGCCSLTNITISDSVITIGEYAFWRCSSLTRITIPSSVIKIRAGAFADCTGLKDVAIGHNVAILEKDAFSGCSNLTSVTIPDPNSLADIQDDVFAQCDRLASVTIGTNIIWCSNIMSTATINREIMRMNWSCGKNRDHALTTTLETLISKYQLDSNQAETCITIGTFLDKEYRAFGDNYDSEVERQYTKLDPYTQSFDTSVNKFIRDGTVTLYQNYDEFGDLNILDLPFLYYSENKREEWEDKANNAHLPEGVEKTIGTSDRTQVITAIFKHGSPLVLDLGSNKIYYDETEPRNAASFNDGDFNADERRKFHIETTFASDSQLFDRIERIKWDIKEAEALPPYDYSWHTKQEEEHRKRQLQQRVDDALK
jgi:BspA type Leucine rich repeat region (6 copies)